MPRSGFYQVEATDSTHNDVAYFTTTGSDAFVSVNSSTAADNYNYIEPLTGGTFFVSASGYSLAEGTTMHSSDEMFVYDTTGGSTFYIDTTAAYMYYGGGTSYEVVGYGYSNFIGDNESATADSYECTSGSYTLYGDWVAL